VIPVSILLFAMVLSILKKGVLFDRRVIRSN
jgi:hypothetical protein